MDNNTEAEIKEKFRSAKNRLVLLDYDGTLVNHTPLPETAIHMFRKNCCFHTPLPETAILPEHMSDIIIKLVDNPQTKIFIITGRGRSDIDKFLDHIPINIIAEHGAMIKLEGVWKNQIINNFSWKKAILPVLKQITDACPESYVEEKYFSLAWHYRNVDADLGYSCSRELIHLLKGIIHSYNLRILDGNKVVEILTNETGKGSAVKKLFEQQAYDFVLSIGDDATDEEMFEFFLNHQNAFTVKVGTGPTHARYRLKSINEVASLLNKLSG